MARCLNCGTELGENKVCPTCGAAVVNNTPKGSSQAEVNSRYDINDQYLDRNKKKSHTVLAVVTLLLFWPVGLCIMWGMTDWPQKVKIGISVALIALTVLSVVMNFINN